MSDIKEIFGEVIHAYTRAQAIEDGFLVDVSEQASSKTGFMGGFTVPVAITDAVHADIERFNPRGLQDYRGRLHDVLWMASLAVRRACGESQCLFGVIMQVGRTKRQVYKIVMGPGDDAEPVITIMKREES